ncbi:MAG: hypothetical protein AAGD07_15075 [Planctomycetota bacterium]
MQLTHRLPLAAMIVVSLSVHCSGVEFENSLFRVNFSTEPHVIIDADGASGAASVTNFSKTADAVEIVQHEGSMVNMLEALDDETRNKIYDGRVAAMQQAFGAENTKANPIQVQGLKGVEITCQSPERGASFSRSVIAGHYVFHLMMIFTPDQKVDHQQVADFFDSFVILDDSENRADAFNIIADKGKRFRGLALPNVRGFSHTLPGSTEKVEWYLSRKEGQLFGILVAEFPGRAGDEINEFTAARNAARIAGTQLGKAFNEVSVRDDESPWRDQAYQSGDKSHELALKVRTVGERVFIAMASGPSATFGSDEQKEYLQRFKVLVE